MAEPTMHEAKELYSRLSAVPAMPHRGPSRERRTILLAALKQAYDQGKTSRDTEPTPEQDPSIHFDPAGQP